MIKKSTLPATIALLLIASCAMTTAGCLLGDDIGTLMMKAGTVIVPGANLAAKLEWLKTNAKDGGSYTIEVTADESIDYFSLHHRDNIITLKGIGANRTISLSAHQTWISSGVTLVLDNNITLQGQRDNTYLQVIFTNAMLVMNNGSTIFGNIVVCKSGGTFIMNGGVISGRRVLVEENATFTMNGGTIFGVSVTEGATFTMNNGTISGNTSFPSSDGGGVSVYNGGIFTMNGGEISGNSVGDGGGVSCGGTFTMNGGTISGNTVSNNGGGVYIRSTDLYVDGTWTSVYGTFTMNGGTISGNTSSPYGDGGGVFVGNGTFTMSGGEISGNSTTSSYNGGGGGGVFVGNGTFTMEGGVISGNSADHYGGGGVYVGSGTFTMSGGTIFGNTAANTSGGGVYVRGTFTKTGGTITGYAGDPVNGNVVRDDSGAVINGRGHAVYAGGKLKETTAGPGVNLSYASSGTWSGGWDY